LRKKIFNKLLWLIPSLILGSICIFLLSNCIPQDDVETKLLTAGISQNNATAFEKEYEKLYLSLHKNLPLFYFSILPQHYHDNVRSIINKEERAKISTAQSSGYNCSHILSSKEIKPVKSNFFLPKIVFHGVENQYQYYFSSLLRLDFGSSKRDGNDVWPKISNALKWTLSIVAISLILSLFISYFFSKYLVLHPQSSANKLFQKFSFILYSIPGFWLATLVLVLFTGDQYGMPIFYTPLYTESSTLSYADSLLLSLQKIAPIIFCFLLIDVAFLTRLLSVKLTEELDMPYMLSLKSRGIKRKQLLANHALPNVMIPITTLIINNIPSALAGSLVFEVVFNIQGMGRLLYDSIHQADWSITYGIVLLLLLITTLVFGAGEIIYRKLDPRIIN
jgi:ABC-type dipeptide/oligopeptide/nickel transport system permease component